MYLSRLAAQKEHAFMKVLYREGFPVPEPVAWSRHTVVMQFIDAFPLRMIDSVPEPGELYAELMSMIVRLAQRGLIHGDFNEFNILIKEHSKDGTVSLEPILIDFPQTMSTNHTNAEFYFDRDVQCIKRYFDRRFKYTSDDPGPHYKDAVKDINPEARLDIEVEATGFSRKLNKDLERFVVSGDQGAQGTEESQAIGSDGDDNDSEDEDRDDLQQQYTRESAEAESDGFVPHAGVDLDLQALHLSDELDLSLGPDDALHGHNLELVQDSTPQPEQSTPVIAHSEVAPAQSQRTKKSAGWSI